ncbi:DUF1772 domain-containing protein [Stenotrophomonas sp. HITSZ_GD]|uniref:DUF1772 domain-containing protein n=1 Tax=Stenotrophomonas sp. HITSZ_GD TaxID=3037248 RepID=UPI00240E5192|nr:DUF1772 domain-containing protein [Stenotrophomonas sp. HITSZ_GD]MDG2524666.1 DUF1772 domain-containing protein [Stenotrophomonas sp. HITSZ_GD]
MSSRTRITQAFLWASTFAWGIGLGAKIFDLLVVAGAWGASPPASFALLPYGPKYPMSPGGFFQPLSIFMAITIVGALVAGWNQPRAVRPWLLAGTGAFVVIWAITPTIFWPMINAQYDIATGKAVASVAQAVELTARWRAWDGFRIALIAVGFLASVRALTLATPGIRLPAGEV